MKYLLVALGISLTVFGTAFGEQKIDDPLGHWAPVAAKKAGVE